MNERHPRANREHRDGTLSIITDWERKRRSNRTLFMAMERDKAFNSTDALFFRVFCSTIRTFTIVRDARCNECIPRRRVAVIGETLIALKINASMSCIRLEW